MELSRRGCPRSIAHAPQRVCVRTITVGGLDNVIDVRTALNELLNVVVSTNTMKHAIHEVGLEVIPEAKEVNAYGQECALQVGLCSASSRLDYP